MIAVDTNVVVRVITNDDPAQARAAAAVLERETVFLPVSVVLETEWVLRSVYDLDRVVVVRALRRFLGIPTVRAESAVSVRQALAWYEEGFDFADALHLASASEAGADRLVTFDGRFRRLADERTTGVAVMQP